MLTSEQFENDWIVFNFKKSSPRCPLIFHENTSFLKVKNMFYAIDVKEEITTAMLVKQIKGSLNIQDPNWLCPEVTPRS